MRPLIGLSLAPEHRRGHGGLYDAINNGRVDLKRLRTALAGLPLPRATADANNSFKTGARKSDRCDQGYVADGGLTCTSLSKV